MDTQKLKPCAAKACDGTFGSSTEPNLSIDSPSTRHPPTNLRTQQCTLTETSAQTMSSPSPKLITLSSTSPSARDPKCNTYLKFLQSDACTLESTQQIITRWRRESYISSLVVVIVNKANDTVIGDTGFQQINFGKKTGELGIMIDSDPAIRGNGYATEILDILFSYAFDENHLGLEKVVFYTNGENTPMRELLKRKLGLEERYQEDDQDWEYSADRAWWARRRAGGVVVDVVEEPLQEKP
ncbi:hypothetical protein NMY22_g7717 [Coprinellus aureogranulatus]|nr:hypothetical protein NMY22_g7717 [Coprinellus aureogranulatus]